MAKADLKTVQDLYNPTLEKCPYCGSEEFYYKQFMSGTGRYNARFDCDYDKVENGDMHENLNYKPIGKFAYCNECDKKVFRFKK